MEQGDAPVTESPWRPLRNTTQLENGTGDTQLLIYCLRCSLLRPLVAKSHQNILMATLIPLEDQGSAQSFQEGNTKMMRILLHPYPGWGHPISQL